MEVRIEFGHKLIISLYVLVDVPARILLATMYYFIFFFRTYEWKNVLSN